LYDVVFCSQEEYNKKKIEAEAKGEEFTEDAPVSVLFYGN